MTITAYGATAADRPLEPMTIERRATGAKDVRIAIAYCGICHSDLHQVRGEWGGTLYPCVPGHEIVGEITSVGSEVAGFAVGDTVGVGCMVDSCGHCGRCTHDHEQYCENGTTFTYNSPIAEAPGHTLGGYAEEIVVAEHFVLRIGHDREQLAAMAPLLCAKHGIVADIDMIAADGIEDGYERMQRGDVKYRFVIDTATMTD